MKFINLSFFFSLAIPSLACAMDAPKIDRSKSVFFGKDITNLRGAHMDESEEDSAPSSTNSSITMDKPAQQNSNNQDTQDQADPAARPALLFTPETLQQKKGSLRGTPKTPKKEFAEDNSVASMFNVDLLRKSPSIDDGSQSTGTFVDSEDAPLPQVPDDRVEKIAKDYENAPILRRPLPPFRVQSNDNAPISIEEMPDPDFTEKVCKPNAEDLQTNFQELPSHGAQNVNQFQKRKQQVSEQLKKQQANSGMSHNPQIRVELRPDAQKPSLSAPNILISAGLFGLLTWLQESYLNSEATKSTKLAVAQEFAHGAQQAAAANIAQQFMPGKVANSFAFTATFAILHACEIGLKKAAQKLATKTKIGKKIAATYDKLSPEKQKLTCEAGMIGSWLLKTVIARKIAA